MATVSGQRQCHLYWILGGILALASVYYTLCFWGLPAASPGLSETPERLLKAPGSFSEAWSGLVLQGAENRFGTPKNCQDVMRLEWIRGS